jgi:hypothetical protein
MIDLYHLNPLAEFSRDRHQRLDLLRQHLEMIGGKVIRESLFALYRS